MERDGRVVYVGELVVAGGGDELSGTNGYAMDPWQRKDRCHGSIGAMPR